MTTGRSTKKGPAHLTVAGRSVCGGALSTIPAGDARMCRQCERFQARHTKEETK